MSRPLLTVIAGPNGSGKSTLIDYLRKSNIDFGEYINADEIAKSLKLVGDTGSREAQKIADEKREDCLGRGVDFSFETVMSHVSKVDFRRRAKMLGYEVLLYFIATGDPELNVERVRARVKAGGHPVPEERIVSRYWRTLELLPSAIIASDRAFIFDNSAPALARENKSLRVVIEFNHVFFEKLDGQELNTKFDVWTLNFCRPVPAWTIEAMKFTSIGFELELSPIKTSDLWLWKRSKLAQDVDVISASTIKSFLATAFGSQKAN